MSLSAACAGASLVEFADSDRRRNGNTISRAASPAAERIFDVVAIFMGVSVKGREFILHCLERSCPNFLQTIFRPFFYCACQVLPPSAVANLRPSLATMDADRASR